MVNGLQKNDREKFRSGAAVAKYVAIPPMKNYSLPTSSLRAWMGVVVDLMPGSKMFKNIRNAIACCVKPAIKDLIMKPTLTFRRSTRRF